MLSEIEDFVEMEKDNFTTYPNGSKETLLVIVKEESAIKTSWTRKNKSQIRKSTQM